MLLLLSNSMTAAIDTSDGHGIDVTANTTRLQSMSPVQRKALFTHSLPIAIAQLNNF